MRESWLGRRKDTQRVAEAETEMGRVFLEQRVGDQQKIDYFRSILQLLRLPCSQ